MKVKEFLEYFKDFDPESELKFGLFDVKIDDHGNYQEYTPLDETDVKHLDETDTVFIALEWGD